LSDYAVHLVVPNIRKDKTKKVTKAAGNDSESDSDLSDRTVIPRILVVSLYYTSIYKIDKIDDREYEAVDILSRDLRELQLRWRINTTSNKSCGNKFMQHVSTYTPKKLASYCIHTFCTLI
jgi:hypothetical protein